MITEAIESEFSPEIIDLHSIGIVTATFYPDWYPGEALADTSAEKIRGDLALKRAKATVILKVFFVKEPQEWGFLV